MNPAVLADPSATIQVLTEDDWAPWMVAALKAAARSVHISVYMISPHWRAPGWHNLDILYELAQVTRRGAQGRLIVDQPNVPYTTHPFNVVAARTLAAAGWKVRVMPDARTLHEKVLIIDRALSVVGSHNLSRASATSNYDTSLAVRSTLLAEHLHRQFWSRWRLSKTLDF